MCKANEMFSLSVGVYYRRVWPVLMIMIFLVNQIFKWLLSPLSEVKLSDCSLPAPAPPTSISGRHGASFFSSLSRVLSLISGSCLSLFDLVRGPLHYPDYFRDQVTTTFPPRHTGKTRQKYQRQEIISSWKLCNEQLWYSNVFCLS